MKSKSIHGQSVAVNVRLSAETYTALTQVMKKLDVTKTQAIELSILQLATALNIVDEEVANELHGQG